MIAEKLNGVKSIYIYSLTRSNQIYEYEYIYYYSADMTDMSVRDKMKEKKMKKKKMKLLDYRILFVQKCIREYRFIRYRQIEQSGIKSEIFY